MMCLNISMIKLYLYAIRWHVIRAPQHRIDDNSNLTNQKNKLSTIFSILQNLLKILTILKT